MTIPDDITFCHVPHGSELYDETIRLRDAVLRKPLGLTFDPADLAAESDSFHLAAVLGERVVACVVLKLQADGVVRLRQMAVAADRQRTGLGSRLIGFAEAFLRDRGFRRIELHARATAVAFYQRLGYQTRGKPFTEVGLEHMAMNKTLSFSTSED